MGGGGGGERIGCYGCVHKLLVKVSINVYTQSGIRLASWVFVFNQVQELHISSTPLLQKKNKNKKPYNIKVLSTVKCSLEQFSTFQIATFI